ncbi:uncharacterized protein LOC125024880 [Penaeus chinensis]|uniref:uncharacterized protein LOC125024880 n=1 Tax=Penaeus chinensis TaxID=139456 RepID=UPI001FB82CC9|nr:uncharacterized protein LOC125024880 [Penaeus chinensis]
MSFTRSSTTHSLPICVCWSPLGQRLLSSVTISVQGTGITKIRILGIPENKREEFAIKYHEEMLETPNNCDKNSLVQYLRKMSINFTDYWRIPNNLCKLVIVWTHWPDTLDGVTTATELLKVTEELLTKSIKERVSQKPECNDLFPEDITRKIDDFFRPKMYENAFYGQREGLSLSDESETELRAVCEKLKLPSTEVLGGFFAQRNIWTKTGTSIKYSYTHKGSQDFYAALHILHNLRSQSEGASSGRSIRVMLEGQDIKKYQEVLKHLIGLLYTEGGGNKASEEIVQLLEESGVCDKEAWLDILSNVKANDVIAKLVSKYVPDVMHLRGCTFIEDSNVAVYAKLLKTANPKKIRVIIRNSPCSVPSLQDLFETMCLLNSEVKVCFQKDFLEPWTATSVTDIPLRTLFERGTIKAFTGCAREEVLAGLPESIAVLHVSVADCNQMEHLISTVGRLKQLEWLCIHAAAGVDVRSQPALSNIDHILYEAEGDSNITLIVRRKTRKVPLDKPHVEEFKLLYQNDDLDSKLHVDEKFLLAFEMSHLHAALNVLGDCDELHHNIEVRFHYQPTQSQHTNSAGNGNRSVSGCSGVSSRYSFTMNIYFNGEDGQYDNIEWHIPGDPEEIPRLKELIVATAGKTEFLQLIHDFRYPRDGGSILEGFLMEEFQR